MLSRQKQQMSIISQNFGKILHRDLTSKSKNISCKSKRKQIGGLSIMHNIKYVNKSKRLLSFT